MKTTVIIFINLIIFSSPLLSQERDSARIGIHQMETEQHRWDVLKTHPSIPQLQRGVELAQQGNLKSAIRSFQKASSKRKYLACFNLGVVYFEMGNYQQAQRYFQQSYNARKDSVCREYLKNTRRLLKESKKQK
ncbi:MAG: tetratricopeptide repeat protein [bacterium]